jgi:hypothetical protein
VVASRAITRRPASLFGGPDGLIRSSSGGWPFRMPSIETVSELSGLTVTFSGCWLAA